MQFKHPEILYALFLLIIPILIHLFQLRRFQKVAFTNVKFLKELELQTRKSSKLKKILILCSRLLLFTALILAFAQPFLGDYQVKKPTNTAIYLDNSYSMQAKGKDGELFKRAIQDLIIRTSTLENINLFTNNNSYKNLSSKDLKNTLLSLEYHPVKTDLKAVLLRIKNITNKEKTLNNVFLISDFQKTNFLNKISIDSLNDYYITQLSPVKASNISIDSVYVSEQNSEAIKLTTHIKNYGTPKENIAINLYNDNLLAGKSSVSLPSNSTEKVTFKIPSTQNFIGKLELVDNALNFDNELYFTIDKPKKINVTAIGNQNNFLSKIYTKDEFNFTNATLNNLDYNTIDSQHLLILNELESLTPSLNNTLKDFTEKGGSLVIIPPQNANINTYNTLLKSLNVGNIKQNLKTELSITSINFSHPLLKGVFEKQIKNFQYPTVKSSYTNNFNHASSIVNFENGNSFISQITPAAGKIYWLSASIATQNSNFKNSPLIVPIFYNFGLYSTHISQLYYTIGNTNTIEVNEQLKKDEVIHLTTINNDYIPLQQIKTNKVILTTEENPIKSGITKAMNNGQILKALAYNYNREESDLSYINTKTYFGEKSNITYSNTINDAFISLSNTHKINNLWQLFLSLALFFLMIEILLLKFFKS
ncbi:MAG TPA: hypothetical protein DDZ39_10540 [Flavobacteriaceae bacterium]|jgi:hypothetical protein|nr:hypothetical protein [Flavobacteriaceae bacterium]